MLSAILVVSIWSCSTKKNTFTRRVYHNTTARYNGYFNAKEIVKANELKLREQHKDDFSELIPLFIYPDEAYAKSIFPDMDKVISKCSEVIDRHSLYVRKEEHNKWIDDAYFLIGKARFYKQEYFIAAEVFEYVAKAFKKKPIKYNALIWLARTYMELNELDKAESYLNIIEEEGNIPSIYRSDYNAVYADFYIRKNQHSEAVEKLTNAVKWAKKRPTKLRYNYVLAQLWLKQKDYTQSSQYFTEVIKLRPKYDMMFNAKINRALSYDVTTSDSDVKKMLHKMVRDVKYEEFLDQVYYALADIAFKENKEDEGIEYLKKSTAASVNNNKQKALSYLRLGELYYEKPDYINAQTYYDSCLVFLPKDHQRYDVLFERNKALKNLVDAINTVTLEDSLLRMADDKQFRKKAIRQLVKKAQEEEEEKNKQLANENNELNVAGGGSSTSSWYFYNATTLQFGFDDFRKNWGDRPLEDNWRRSNKQSVADFDDEQSDSDSTTTNNVVVNEKTNPEYYLQFIPSTDEEKRASHNNIIESLYTMGNVYREDFENYSKATEAFEDLINRYDTCRYKLPSWYNLYRIGLLTDNDEQKQRYKKKILNNYPESEYARIISDPSYNKVTRENRKRVDNYYSIVYELFDDRKYEKVLIRCKKAKAIFADNHISDKFDLLAALSTGHVNTRDSFKLALEDVVAKHPKTESGEEAKRLLKMINDDIKPEPSPTKTTYYHDPKTTFLFVMVMPSKEKKMNNYRADIADFCAKYYSEKNYKVGSIILDKKRQLITVKSFKDFNEAMDFYKSFGFNKDNLNEVNQQSFENFIISEANFKLFYKKKDVAEYLSFFAKNAKLK